MRSMRPGDPKRGGVAPLKDVLATWIKASGMASKFRDAEAFRAWREALGPTLAARAVPVRFDHGELTLEVRSAAHLHEFQNFSGETYRRAANQKLGAPRITRVVFRLAR
jgi:hypothetical protein